MKIIRSKVEEQIGSLCTGDLFWLNDDLFMKTNYPINKFERSLCVRLRNGTIADIERERKVVRAKGHIVEE